MTSTVTLPAWLFFLILLFAAVTFASHFLFPSVRWYFRRRAERVVARINARLERPIQPFKLARRSDMIQRLLYDPEVTQAIVDHAREKHVREDVAFELARRYAREIVPSFSATAYFSFAIRLARLLSTALYHVRLGYLDEEALDSIDREATVVYVMNHRSNMDYVLVTYLAARRSALSYAVGEWARVWPLSILIKAMGAYFIRRKSRGALYRRVLARYVQMATRAGVAQAMFPEGGLSLDGAIAEPKRGLLKYLTDGVDLAQRDVVFVPVALNYDRVLEDRILLAAGAAGTRRFRARISVVAFYALRLVWRRLTGRSRRFGNAAVSFGAPLSLRAAPKMAQDTDALAEEVMARIAAAVPVLPVPLVAYALLSRGARSRSELERDLAEILSQVPEANVFLPRDNRGLAVETALKELCRRKLVSFDGDRYSAAEQERDTLGYYANSIRHLLGDVSAPARS